MKLVRIIQNEMFWDVFLVKYNTKYTKKTKKPLVIFVQYVL